MIQSDRDTETDPLPFPGPGTLEKTTQLVRFLRNNCPWDREQTAESLIPHLLEEVHEVVDAIREGSSEDLEGELGDLLLNLAFQIVVAEESDSLDTESVYRHLEEKMVRRHPQLFGNDEEQNWERLKQSERAETEGVLAGIASGLDPLTASYRIQERVASVGFDWKDYKGAREKVLEELHEVTEAAEAGDSTGLEEELGDLLFAVINLTRLAGSHPTTVLARANIKFCNRFELLEKFAQDTGIIIEESSLEVLDSLWEKTKKI